jgi:uncharacterized membrane protein YeaQ/YmgE (transglycosylase-associated protein family)
MIGLIISSIVVGLIAGALARLVVPGKQDMSIPMTIVIGVIGPFVRSTQRPRPRPSCAGG